MSKEQTSLKAWKEQKIKDICSFNIGRTPSRSNAIYWEDGFYNWISIKDMADTPIIIDTAEKVSQKAFKECFNGKIVPAGTLLMSFKLTIGRTSFTGVDAFHNEAIVSIYPDKEKADANYLFYVLPVIDYSKYINPVVKGKTLNKDSIKAVELLLPPLSEQKAIAKALQSVQACIETRKKEFKLEKERKNALMEHLFTYGIMGEALKDTEIGKIPESWDVVKLEDIAVFKRGKDLPVQDRKEGTIPVIGSSGQVGWHNESPTIFPVPGVSTGRSGSIGLLTYTPEPYWALNTALYVCDFKGNNPLFVYYWLHMFDFKKYSQGVSVPTLNRNLIHPVLFPLPKHDEQLNIADVMSKADNKIQSLEKEIKLYDELFKAMLDELMTGKLSALPLIEKENN